MADLGPSTPSTRRSQSSPRSPGSIKQALAAKDSELKRIKEKAKEYIFKTKADLKHRDATIKKLEDAIKDLEGSHTKTKNELLKANVKIKELEDNLATDIKALKSDHEKAMAHQKKRLEDTERQFQQERKGMEEQQKVWAARREESHSTDLSTLQENNTLLKRKFVESQEELKEMGTKIIALTQELERKNKDMNEYKHKVRAKIEKANMDIRAKKQLQVELEAQKQKVAWAERRILDMKREMVEREDRRNSNASLDMQSLFSNRPQGLSKQSALPSSSAKNSNSTIPNTDLSHANQLERLRYEMQMEEMKARHASELAKVRTGLTDTISALQTQLAQRQHSLTGNTNDNDEAPNIERTPSETLERLEGKSLEEQVEYWREEKQKGDVELKRMEQALESWRDQLSGTKNLSVSNLKLKESLADANRSRLQAQQQALRLSEQLRNVTAKATELQRKESHILAQHAKEKKNLEDAIAELKSRLQNTNVDKVLMELRGKHEQELRDMKGSFEDKMRELRKNADTARKQAEGDRKKRNYAKTEFLKVFEELEGLRKKIGQLRIERDVMRKRFLARISDLENLLGLDESEFGDLSRAPSVPMPLEDRDGSFTSEGGEDVKLSAKDHKTEMFDIELLEVPRTLADVSYEMIESQCRSVADRVEKCLKRVETELKQEKATGSKIELSIPDVMELDSGRHKSNPSKALTAEARAIRMDLEGILNMITEVAVHQRKCQTAITNLGASVGTDKKGVMAGIRLICSSMCGGVVPSSVPRRERGGAYKYEQVP